MKHVLGRAVYAGKSPVVFGDSMGVVLRTSFVALLLGLVLIIQPVESANAGNIQISRKTGCKKGLHFVRKEVNENYDGFDIITCYRRSNKTQVVTEYTVYLSGNVCDRRGIVTLRAGYWNWKSYSLGCY